MLIELEKIEKTYVRGMEEVNALQGVDLDIDQNEYVISLWYPFMLLSKWNRADLRAPQTLHRPNHEAGLRTVDTNVHITGRQDNGPVNIIRREFVWLKKRYFDEYLLGSLEGRKHDISDAWFEVAPDLAPAGRKRDVFNVYGRSVERHLHTRFGGLGRPIDQ